MKNFLRSISFKTPLAPLIRGGLLLLTFFLTPFAAHADESWERELIFVDGVATLEEDFTTAAFLIPEETQLSYYDGKQWRPLFVEEEKDPHSRWSELVFWGKEDTFLLRADQGHPITITASLFRADKGLMPRAMAATDTAAFGAAPSIISRAEWGADESIRYNGEASADLESRSDNGEGLSAREKECVNAKVTYPDEFDISRVQRSEDGHKLIWPYYYSKAVHKIVIHHTGSTKNENVTSDQSVRAIYNYHTKTRGWGDVGYHYLIGRDGRIYQGRAGGDYVVGGHVYCNNIGTISIALIGNFQEEEPTVLQKAALDQLAQHLVVKYKIDLSSDSWYHGKKTPNLVGHRDLGSTACPGENLYSYLPTLRAKLSGTDAVKWAQQFIADGMAASELKVLEMQPGERETIELAFKNTGSVTWDSKTWLFALAGEGLSVDSLFPDKPYVASQMKEQRVAPGQTAHFRVDVSALHRGGISTVSFVPVVNEKRVYNAEVLQVVQVEKPQWSGVVEQIKTNPTAMLVGQSTDMLVYIRNESDFVWRAGDLVLELETVPHRKKVSLPLLSDAQPGENALFSGRVPAFDKPEEEMFLFQLWDRGSKTTFRFSELMKVNTAEYRGALDTKISKVTTANTVLWEKDIEVQNTGSIPWTNPSASVRCKHDYYDFTPTQTNIGVRESATYLLEIPTNPKLTPCILSLYEHGTLLDKKVFLLRGDPDATEYREIDPAPEVTTPVAAVDKEALGDPIRIHLHAFRDTRVHVTTTEGMTFDVFDEQGQLLADDYHYVLADQSGAKVKFGKREHHVLRIVPNAPASQYLEVKSWERHPAWDTQEQYNDNLFFGTLELRVLDGKLAIINELPLEQYLLGIAETLESDHPEKQKAIAVAARNYATYYLTHEKFPGKPYDGNDDPAAFQKYLGAGYTFRAPNWRSAIEATSEQVLRYEGEVVKTPFHTCAGGQTISAQEKWGWTNTPYLPSVADPGGGGKEQLGHGVGLSACSAQYFADTQGWTYMDILNYFYPGTVLDTGEEVITPEAAEESLEGVEGE